MSGDGVDRWSDVEPRLLSLHQVAEMALALDHYWRWFGDDCGCNDGSKEPCPIYDGVTAARHALAPDNRDPDRPDWDRRRAALAVIPEAPAATGTCAACGGPISVSLTDGANGGKSVTILPAPAPPEADSAAETLERIRQIVAEWEAMRVDPDVERTDNDTDAIHAIADLLRGGA